MARLGVTYQDVTRAITALTTEGRRPTIQLIRQYLGTGSSSTIAAHLRLWRTQQAGYLPLQNHTLSGEESISTIKILWAELHQYAQEKIKLNDAKYEAALAKCQEMLQKYKNNNQRWQNLFAQWLDEKNKLVMEQTTSKTMINQLHQEYERLKTQFKEVREGYLQQEKSHEKEKLALQDQINQLNKRLVAISKKTIRRAEKNKSKAIYVKHIAEPHKKSDGYRVFVDRLWPRGVKRKQAKIDKWIKEIAPTHALHAWFSNDLKKWATFQKRYQKELARKKTLLETIQQLSQKRVVTLLSNAKSNKHHALVLQRAVFR